MTIEEKVFKRTEVDFNKLEQYGFVRSGTDYRYERIFMDGDFKALITIDATGKISGEVYDLASEDIYFPLRVEEMSVGYVGEVRAAYEMILQNIKAECCTENYFVSAQANRIAAAILQKYGDKPDFPWEKDDNYGVFRNPNNKKWYALIMPLDRCKLEPKSGGEVEVVNLKLDAEKIPLLVQKSGFYPAYHMNKKNWITVVLDETLNDTTVLDCIEESHAFTLGKKGRSAD